ncbi:MAG: phosphorelay protein [Magnetospiraceae bacterium]
MAEEQKISASGDDNDEVVLIKPKDTLKQKVIGTAATSEDAMLAAAEQAVAALAADYPIWAKKDLDRLVAAHRRLVSDPSKDNLLEIFEIAHEVKGQGGTFGYDLMTIVGNSLCRFVEHRNSVSPSEIAVIKVHIDTLNLVLSEQITGNGGVKGTQILRGLEMIVEKVTN